MEKHIIEIDTIKCIGCSMCVRDCPNNNISTTAKNASSVSYLVLKDEKIRAEALAVGFFTFAANMSFSLRKALGLKYKTNVVTTLVLGYPAVTYYRTTQKKLASVSLQ